MAKYQDDVLNARETTHGNYPDVATTAQAIKEVLSRSANWDQMPDHMRESLDLIATKMARIVNGNFSEPDHWEDIGGYAHLCVYQLNLHTLGVAAVAASLHEQIGGKGTDT